MHKETSKKIKLQEDDCKCVSHLCDAIVPIGGILEIEKEREKEVSTAEAL